MRRIACLAATLFIAIASQAQATVVHIQTNLSVPGVGNSFNIELFDGVAPATVQNFLSYAQSGRYNDSFFHRSIDNFVVQGGGYNWSGGKASLVAADPPVANEYSLSNVRGTLAVALPPGNINGGTSQFFVNVKDNSGSLDPQKFAVFGKVLGDGMSVIDAINKLTDYNAGAPFDNLPLQNYTSPNPVTADNLVLITSATILAAVPEPATLATFGVGGLLTLMWSWRRSRWPQRGRKGPRSTRLAGWRRIASARLTGKRPSMRG